MKKLKHQYRQSIQSTHHDYFWEIYPNVRSSVFKKFSTHQERSFYFLHRIEYRDYPLRLRVEIGLCNKADLLNNQNFPFDIRVKLFI